MTNFKKIFHLMESIDSTYKNHLINEISIIDKYNIEKEKNNYTIRGIDFNTFEELCNIDPTTKPNKVGKYCNWLIAKYNPNANFNELKRCLEWFADGVKRNILTRYNIPSDINSFKTYEELIETINNLNDNNDDLDISSSEYNNRSKLEGQFEVLGSNSSYDIIAPKTFEAERYFGSSTEWCTVANIDYFSEYMKQGQLYILYPKNGDSEYKMQFHFEKEEFADKYNNVLDDPIECIESVIEDDSICDDLIDLCKKAFAENAKYMKHFLSFEEALNFVSIELENGVNPQKLFDCIKSFHEGFAEVRLKGKYNFINTEGKLLNPNKWFNAVYNFSNGFAVVGLNEKCNFINTEGEYLFPNQWFDGAYSFSNGLARVLINDKGWNLIKTDGEFLHDDLWFDEVERFSEGFAKVRLNKKYNFINTEGEFLRPDMWFDDVYSFWNGFGIVVLDSKGWNFIKTDGEFLSPNQWFDKIRKTENLYRVFLRDKGFNYINSNGEYVSEEWFAEAGLLRRGRTEVKLFNGEKFSLVIHPHNKNKVILRKKMDESKNYPKRNIIRLTESDLHKVIKESVKKVLREYSCDYGIPVKN